MATLTQPSTAAVMSSKSTPSTQIEPTTNVLLTSFAGLGLPRTLNLPVKTSTPVREVVATILNRLPPIEHQLIITTTSNKQLLASDNAPISTLIHGSDHAFLPLRLSARLCGGKGGFGSQLRAAGGRMSSRKNRNGQANQNPNGSNRNLDGRRLRVIDSAKDLARYLATKPEMDAKEKEEKRKRWEAVVESAERREAEIRSGKGGKDKGRLDAGFVESKDLAEEKTREAVLKALREEMGGLERTGSESSVEVAEDEEGSEDDVVGESSGSSDDAKEGKPETASRTFYGWDEEDEDSEEDEDDDSNDNADAEIAYEGRGKGRAS